MSEKPSLIPISEIRKRRDRGEFKSWDLKVPEGLDCMAGWQYLETQTDVFEYLTGYSKRSYLDSNQAHRNWLVDYVASAYEEAKAFPITYFSEAEARRQIKELAETPLTYTKNLHQVKYSPLTQYFEPTKWRAGANLCEWMFCNLFDAYVDDGSGDDDDDEANGNAKRPGSKKKRGRKEKISADGVKLTGSTREQFTTPETLRKIFHTKFKYQKEATPWRLRISDVRRNGYFPRNFSPMVARSLVEYYLPEGGRVLDPSAGFGGRMLGTLTAPGNCTYIGIDPEAETMSNLDRFGQLIEEATGTKDRYELYCDGSQNVRLDPKSVDLAFSSPPYFGLERYHNGDDEEGRARQSVGDLTTLQSWITEYAAPTIQNVAYALKPGAFFLTNITDYEVRGKRFEFVDEWINAAEDAGLELVDTHYLGNRAPLKSELQTHRKRVNALDEKPNAKIEPILVFKKRR